MVGSQHLDGVGDIYLFGNGARDEAFTSYLSNRFHLQIKAPSPFESLGGDAAPMNSSVDAAEATHYATAVGLALQPAGGQHG